VVASQLEEHAHELLGVAAVLCVWGRGGADGDRKRWMEEEENEEENEEGVLDVEEDGRES
jgi:hypothetical protein